MGRESVGRFDGPFEFRLLGPTEVLRAGEPLRFRGTRERDLLTLLVVQANRVVTTEQLVEDLWAGTVPHGAVRSLRVYVSRIRQTLAGPNDLVVTAPAGYMLRTDPAAIDSTRFDVLVVQGREQAALGHHPDAATTLRAALALWRGPALMDVADRPSAQAEATRLEEARLTAVEERVEADLACGRHGELIGELETLSRAHPLRERLWSHRMIALYRASRQAEALRAYQELRRILAEELGIEPSHEVRRLEAAVLRQAAELDLRPSAEEAAAVDERARTSTQPLPVTTGGRTPFVGRETERARLRDALDAASQSTGTLVLIGGEPGVGKTRLTEELTAEAQRRQMQVFAGHCYEMSGAAPYVAFVEMLESALERAPNPQAFRSTLGDEAAEVAKLLPQLRRLCPDIPPPLELPAGLERRLLFNSLREVVARTARSRPMLLVLDDLQWADEPSLLLLQHMAERLRDLPLLIVGTYRDTDVDVGHPLALTFEDLRRRNLARWMTLRRLPEDGMAEMVEALAGQEPPPTLVQAMFSETEGNPFFVEEVYRYLAEDGRLFDTGGQFRSDVDFADLDVPAGIRLVVGRRLQRVGKDAPRLLAVAAVIGRAFSVEVLEATERVDVDHLVDTIEAAQRARLVVPARDQSGEDRFIFAHELVRQTLLADLSLTRRRRLHLQVADALERRHSGALEGHAAAIAHHLLEAGATGEQQRLFRFLVMAGRWALDAAAFEQAVEYLEKAVTLHPGGQTAEWAGCLDDLARARRSTGHWDTAIDAWRQSVDAYQQIGDVDALGRVCVDAAMSLAFGFRHIEAAEMCQRGLGALGDRVSADRARLLDTMGVILGYAGDYQAGAVMIDQAMDLAVKLGDDGALGHALLNKSIHRWAWLEHEETIAAGREAAARLEGSGDVFQVATVLAFVALALMHVGRLDEARQVTQELEPSAERLGNHMSLLIAERVAGMAAFFETGDITRLEAFGQADLAEATRLGLPWVSQGWAWQGVAAFLRGDWEVARTRFEEARGRELPGALHGWDTGPLIECLAYLGQRSEAMSLLDGAVSQLPDPGSPIGWGACTIVVAGVESFVVLGESERAAALYALTVETLRRTRSVTGNFYDGRLLERVAGIAAMAGRRWDESEAHFRAALEQAQTIPHRTEQAHTRRWYGHMLLQRRGRGDAEQARRLLEAAIADYDRMAMPRHRELAAALLQGK